MILLKTFIDVTDTLKFLKTRAHSQTHTRALAHAQTRARARARAHTHTHTHTHTYTYARTPPPPHTHRHTPTYTHTRARAHTHKERERERGRVCGWLGRQFSCFLLHLVSFHPNLQSISHYVNCCNGTTLSMGTLVTLKTMLCNLVISWTFKSACADHSTYCSQKRQGWEQIDFSSFCCP